MSGFRKATRQQVKASIMIEGLAGSGKSGLALAIANTLSPNWEKIYAIDAENKSLDLFEGEPIHTKEPFGAFNKVDLTPEEGYAPSTYDKYRQMAIANEGEVLIIDSMSHMWNREGGLLDRVSALSKSNTGRDFNVWQHPEIIKEKALNFDLIRSNKIHTITTVRTKEKFAMEKNETTNKNEVVSLGEQQIQQEGLKYEPDLVLRMEKAGTREGGVPVAKVLKSRYGMFTVGESYEFTAGVLKAFGDYLSQGVSAEEIEEAQKKEFIEGIKEFGKKSKLNMSLWKTVKKDQGFEEVAIEDIPYMSIRKMYYQLVQQ